MITVIIIAGYVLLPILCGVVSWETGRFEHKQHKDDMAAREKAVSVREDRVSEREFELGRRAHDLHTMLTMRRVAIENDTTRQQQIMNWEAEPA